MLANVIWTIGGYSLLVLIVAGALGILWLALRRDFGRWRGSLLFLNHQTVPDIIDQMNPRQFEEWTAALFREIGAEAGVTQAQGDHGIDVDVRYHGRRIAVQCKKYYRTGGLRPKFSGYVGEPILRDLYGTMHAGRYDLAVLITTGWFSRPAWRWRRGKRDLVLIDRNQLAKIIADRTLLQKMLK